MSRTHSAVVLLLAAALVAEAGHAQTTSASQNPTFVFSTPGQKQVTLKSCNAQGCTTTTQTLTVLDPAPVITTASVGSVSVEAGQLVKLVGAGHGQPPLSFTWKVAGPPSQPDIAGAGAWWNTQGVPPGTYTVRLHLQNGVGAAVDSAPATVVVLPETAKNFYTVTPCRLLDTRQSSPLHSGSSLTFPVAGITAFACGIPANAMAVAVNITVTEPTATGMVAVFAGNYPSTTLNTINFSPGQTRSNNAILALASDGSGSLAAQPTVLSNGTVQLIVDVTGYFM